MIRFRSWFAVRREALRAALLRIEDGVADAESFGQTYRAAKAEGHTARRYTQVR